MYTRISLFTTFAVLLVGLAGCGGGTSSVSGKVTVAGKGPLAGGSIRFISVADPEKASGGQIKPDGTYTVPDAPVGPCIVVIDNSHLDPNVNKAGAGKGPGAMSGMKGGPTGAPSTTGGGPKASDKEKMVSGPKGADIPSEMNSGKDDLAGQKFIKLDVSFSKADTTTLKADVKSGSNTFDFEVK